MKVNEKMNGYRKEKIQELFDELNTMKADELKTQIEEYSEMRELSLNTQKELKESYKETEELYNLMLTKENFRKIEPTYKYEELDAFWDLKLKNQRKMADNELSRQLQQIKGIDEEVALYNKLVKKAEVLLKVAEEVN